MALFTLANLIDKQIIVISSLKTWAAVVDSEDRSQARRHMVLWLLTLAGLSVEPIVDAFFSYRVPMYESLKTVVTGWLLIAHFYLSKPSDEQQENDSDSLFLEDLLHSDADQIGSPTGSSRRAAYAPAMKTPLRNRRQDTRLDPTHESFSTSNLDFGRFKRDLERRQSASRSSIVESEMISPSLMSRSRSRLARQDASPAISTTSSGRNPFDVSSTVHSKYKATSQLTTAAREFSTMPTASFSFEKRLREGYEFGSEPSSRKRPLLNLQDDVSHTPSIRRLTKQRANTPRIQGPRQSSGTRSPLGLDTEKKEEDILDSRKIKRTKTSGSAGGQLPSRHHGTDNNEFDRNENHTQAVSRQTLRKSTIEPPLLLSSASRPAATFSRPKPPGKNRTRILSEAKHSSSAIQEQPSRQNGGLSKKTPKKHSDQRNNLTFQETDNVTGDSQLGAASLESRMRHVRDWIKKRNSSMISPSLTETSNNTNSDRRSLSRRDTPSDSNNNIADPKAPHKKQKRKAHRQLVPTTNPKRVAPEALLHSRAQGLRETLGRTSVNNSRDYHVADVHPQSPDTVPATATHVEPAHRQSTSRSQPLTRVSRNNTSDAIPQRHDQDAFLKPLDWSRFQRPHRGLKQSRSLPSMEVSGSSAASPFLTKRTPQKLNGRLSNGTMGGNADDSRDGSATAAISPLIKLRQSQLMQQQQEDFLGIKHGSDTDALRRRRQQQEEEGAFRFNDALDAWEREDDETLALNAAREATEAEVRGQRRSSARQDTHSFSSSSEQEAENDDRNWKKPLLSAAPSVLKSETAMAAPTPSLLRTVPFNGESSRRPVPDLQSNSKHTSGKVSRPEVPFNVSSKSNGNTASQQPEFRGAVSLANSRQLRQQQPRRPVRREGEEEERAAVRRERHPGLYTPSKKNRYLGVEDFDQQSLHKSTPTSMSRYIQLSGLTDDDEDSS
ncbi:hypothetical protein BGZ68_005777 [Mortierella alpina]|nr:hypothetical protein BGZ68_005777 [Mortierella alpina]